mgnify:CR=1 FL=1
MESHLLQMRGLKQKRCATSTSAQEVASFTDAWIETKARILKARKREVASFTDAWIETFNPEFDHIGYQSHLLQMRGLKHFCLDREHHRHSRIFYRCVD